MNIPNTSSRRIVAFIGSKLFFKAIIGLLIFEALWIALSGRYPLAFDEDFHFGTIKLYADHLNPFWKAHPAGADVYGAITRDPSYLYHYVMSFPYRLIRVCTNSQDTQVLIMRLINIGLLTTSLPLFRRLLRRLGASDALSHTVLLLFVLIPIVPMLGAQINYDNLTLPMTAISLLLTLRFTASFKQKNLDIFSGLLLLIICILSSLVKYAYLPIFIGIVGFVLFESWQQYRSVANIKTAVINGWRKMETRRRWWLIGVLLLSSVLFVERYGVNLVRYHTPVPDCAQVLLYDQCQHYGPWIRDYNFEHMKPADSDRSPINYTQHWLYGMWFRSFFAVDGPQTLYQTRGPLLLPAVAAIIGVGLGGISLLFAVRKLLKHSNAPGLILLTAAIYLVVLWLTEYQLFLQTGQPVAINGRYLLPILPGLMALFGLSIAQVLPTIRIRLIVAIVLIACFSWGGGVLTYALRSNDAWYWPQTPLRAANHAVQRYAGPFIPGYTNPLLFLH